MFVKVSRSKNFSYVQIVKSVREDGKIKHQVIGNLGRLDKLLENNQLEKIAKKLYQIATGEKLKGLEIKEIKRLKYGDIVYRKLWEELKLDKIINRLAQKHNYQFDLERTIFYLVVNRLLEPSSKLRAYRQQENFLNEPGVRLQHLYRSLDFLSRYKEEIERQLYNIRRDLFNLRLDLVFYDLTTFHFESVSSDELRDFGFSKSGKLNEVQVILGLLVDRDKRAIGYELFRGNESEKKTVEEILSSLSGRFGIKDVILVIDNGLFSIENIRKILDKGYNVIVRYSVRSRPRQLRSWITEGGFQEEKNKEGRVVLRYKQFDHQIKDKTGQTVSGKLVLLYSERLAQMQRAKRARLEEKAKRLIEEGKIQSKNKRGAYKYVKVKAKVGNQEVKVEEEFELDKERLVQEAELDGYLGIFVAGKKAYNLDAKEIMSQYKLLWQIEDSFRLLKSTMRTRPIYHRSVTRIKGHFMVCFLAFVLERELELLLRKHDLALSSEQIKQSLNSLQVSEIEIEGKRYYLKGRNDSNATKILKIMKIPPRKNLVPKD